MRIKEPTKLIIGPVSSSAVLDQLKAGLTYTDKKVEQELIRFKRNGARWYGEEEYKLKLAEIKSRIPKCLLFEGEEGYWTYSGLSQYVQSKTKYTLVNEVVYPEPKLLPWDQKPSYEMYPYQKEAMEKLLEAKHAGVEMGTGLGKSFIIANVVKQLGLKTIIMTPSANITEKLLTDFTRWFGKKNVGAFFDGKKETKKLITIGTAQSFTRVKKGSVLWKELQATKVFIVDESHQCPAKTLASVCFGLVKDVPYRFFFSATQFRNDGSDLLLDGITGPIVYRMTVREGVDKGFLAKPIFKMFNAPMNGDYWSNDPLDMTRHHLLYNPSIAKSIGTMANYAVKAGFPVLILIEEVEQFTKLLPWLSYEVGFAHGSLTEDNRGKVPMEFHKSDPTELVKRFNEGKLPILVGTSCISTGTDIPVVKFLVYWQGGSSEIQVKQAIGRGTRITSNKNFCHIVDFKVDDRHMDSNGRWKRGPVGRHADIRKEIYDDLYGPVTMAELMNG